MSKYDGLRDALRTDGRAGVPMTFSQIAEVVGDLPRSARIHAAWWYGTAAGSRHVQKRAWEAAGYTVETVDRDAGTVTFVLM